MRPLPSGVRRAVLGLLGALSLVQTTGCYAWKVVPTPTSRDAVKPETVFEVTTIDHHTWRLTNVRYRNDSLIGITATDAPEQVELSIAAIATAKVRKSSALRTIGAVYLGISVVGLALLALFPPKSIDFGGGFLAR